MTIARPQPIFLGYALKASAPPPHWSEDPRIKDICSVSACIAHRPDKWIERWDFNSAGYYATPAASRATAPPSSPHPLHLFAYEFFPLRFEPDGNTTPIDPLDVFGEELAPPPDATPLAGFDFLGYDIVERWSEAKPGEPSMTNALGGGFGCSPLTCNVMSLHHPVNTHALIDDWDNAVVVAHRFAKEQPEPGCYYIFGVYRAPDPAALHSGN